MQADRVAPRVEGDHSQRPTCAPNGGVGAAQAAVTWHVHELPRLTDAESEALLAIPAAWLEQREWAPPKHAHADLLWQYILRHGLEGVFGSLAIAGKVKHDMLTERSTHHFFSNMLRAEAADQACRRVQKVAREVSVPVTFLKGPVLQYQAYEMSGLRAYGDVDIFVPSEEHVRRLIAALPCMIVEDPEARGFRSRVSNPGKISITMQDQLLEFCYPTDPICDPMICLLDRSKDRVCLCGDGLDGLTGPLPEAHFSFLLLHMSVNHWFSRLIWFLDLVQLMRHSRIDPDVLLAELTQLGIRNLAAAVSDFCRQYIDPGFPRIPPLTTGWNYHLICKLVQPRPIIEQNVSIYSASSWTRRLSYVAMMGTFFILQDPERTRASSASRAVMWSSERYLRTTPSLRILRPFLEPWMYSLIVPASAGAMLLLLHKEC